MIAGSLLPQWVGRPIPQEDLHAALHHRAAAETHHAEHLHKHPPLTGAATAQAAESTVRRR